MPIPSIAGVSVKIFETETVGKKSREDRDLNVQREGRDLNVPRQGRDY